MVASSDQMIIRHVPEVTLGVVPATPALLQVPVIGESLNADFTFTQSTELNPTRGVRDTILTDLAVAGDMNFELSYNVFEWLMSMALANTWAPGPNPAAATSATLDNGTTVISHSIQKAFPDLAAPVYMTFAGCVCDKLSLTLAPGAIVTGAATIAGMSSVADTVQLPGATFPALTRDGGVMNTSSNVTSIQDNNVASTMLIANMTVDILNNVRQQKAVGVLGAAGQALGQFNVSGNLSTYFQSITDYNRFKNGTTFSLDVTLTDALGNYYIINLPKVKLNSAKVVAGGNNSDVMADFTYVALQDTVTARTMRITSHNA